MSLEDYGWNVFFARSLEHRDEHGLEPGRVVFSGRGSYRLATDRGEVRASPSGRLRHDASSRAALPVIGDWVAFDRERARIERILERRTKLSRKSAGRRSDEQVVAANVDLVFVTMGLDSDFNLRRVERYLTTAWESGATPVVLLTKLDLCLASEERRRALQEVALGAEVILSSSLDGRGLEEVRARMRPRETSVLVGSSGAGKSTLINRLLGSDAQKTRSVRARDEKGLHTTTDRRLFVLPGGGLLIDNPGMREIQILGREESLDRTFEDVSALAAACRFRDCGHTNEPGCAVLSALESGSLSTERLESFRSLEKELRYARRQQSRMLQKIEKEKWKAIHRELRRSGRHRRT